MTRRAVRHRNSGRAAVSPIAGRTNELLDEVWGYDNYPATRTVDNHIAKLRQKIEETPSDPRYVVTVHRIGYRFLG